MVLTFFEPETGKVLKVPMIGTVAAGFPSPAMEYVEVSLDLNQLVVKNKNSTFYAQVDGQSMIDAGLNHGDILVIDKALEPVNGKIAVCYIDGSFTVKRIKKYKGQCWLMPANKEFEPIEVTEENNAIVWGIVTYVVKKM
ncbi:MAG TPA: translesion error-prone DNA polymerase V autoproteolytic subunit [Chitinophagales bacterium]|nr:translesion error-prone DNA polymerase V autoproteolytic subunit [Chitinophagales bacterium]